MRLCLIVGFYDVVYQFISYLFLYKRGSEKFVKMTAWATKFERFINKIT